MYYTRKWLPMTTLEKMKKLSNLGIKPPIKSYDLALKYPPYLGPGGTIPAKYLKSEEDEKLIKTILDRYPDLQYVNTSYTGLPFSRTNTGNYLADFLYHQKGLIKNGYSKEKAFEMTEKKFQDRFSKKFEAVRVAVELAVNNGARSLLNVAQQQAELEANLKVKRITRDLTLYKEAQAEMDKTLRDFEKEAIKPTLQANEEEAEEEEDFEEDLSEFDPDNSLSDKPINPAEEYVKKYTRVLHKITPVRTEDTNEQNPNKEKRTEVIESFINNTKNMFNLYYERAAALDKLSGLTENEVIDAVARTPQKIKKQSKQLLTKLMKYNIKLDSRGEVDYSQCPYPNVVKKLQENPLVKIVLLQADLEYEAPHREVQMETARKAKLEFEEAKKNREREAQQVAEEEKRRIELERGSTSEQSPFHQQYGIEYPQSEKQVITEVKESAKDKAAKYSRNNPEGLSAAATYRVFETYDERMARLEKKWLKNRLAALEAGVEKPTDTEKKELLDKAVQKLRRLKYLVEQKNLENAKDLLFEEHRVFTKEELEVDKETPVEKFADYLKLPDEKRRLQTTDEIDDNKILNLIKRRDVLEDTAKPFQDNYMYMKTEDDTFEGKLSRMRRQRIAMSQEYDKTLETEDKTKLEVEAEATEGLGAENDEQGKGKKNKYEKKRLIDYIKTSTDKSAAKGKAGKSKK